MKTLREYIEYAETHKKAIPHFNVANSDMLIAVFDGVQKVSQEVGEIIPLIIGVSEGERDAFGETQIDDYIRSLRLEHNYPIFLNADHTYSVERAKDAIDAGYDMVIIDAASKEHGENQKMTREIVEYRNEKNPNILIEAEFGYIGDGAGIKDAIPDGISQETMTKPDEAKAFVEATGIDLLAPSVGNVHGMVKTGNPRLDPERVREVRNAVGVPLVLHGGSGSSDQDFRAVIEAGIAVVHISTELRVAYRSGLEEGMQEVDSVAPYKYSHHAKERVQAVAEARTRLFWGYNLPFI